MRLHTLKPAKGSTHRRKRLGCGESSGHGKTSGKGHKGQKARSGGSIRPGFEGGQMPLIRRLPKRGFNNKAFKKNYTVINLDDLNHHFDVNGSVNPGILSDLGLVNDKMPVKVLGRGEITKALHLEVHAISSAAKTKLEATGSTITIIS